MSSFSLYIFCFIVPLIIGLAVQAWLRKTFAVNSQKPVASGKSCLLYTSPSPRDGLLSRMPSSA